MPAIEAIFISTLAGVQSMDGRTLLSSLVSSLAWPLATIIVALLFRKALSKKLSNLIKVKHRDTELEFDQKLAKFSADAQPLEKAIESSGSGSGSGAPYYYGSGTGTGTGSGASYDLIDTEYNHTRQALVQLAESAPWAVILDGWKRVETKLRALVSQANLEPERSAASLIKQAVDNQLIGPTIQVLLKQFYQLRNTAAHASNDQISREQSLEYIDWTIKLVAALDLHSNTRFI